jgi:hypothetical protein
VVETNKERRQVMVARLICGLYDTIFQKGSASFVRIVNERNSIGIKSGQKGDTTNDSISIEYTLS